MEENNLEKIEKLTDKLKQLESEFERFFNNAPELICVSNDQCIFEKLNPAWEKALGYSLAHLCSKPYLEFVHPDDIAKTLDAIEGMKANKEVKEFRNRYRHANGHYVELEWSASVYCVAGIAYSIARMVE